MEPGGVKVAPWVALRELLDSDRFCSEVEDRDGVRKSLEAHRFTRRDLLGDLTAR